MKPIQSDHKLKLKELWFTGKEWKDGTSTRILEQQYIDAEREYLKSDLANPQT